MLYEVITEALERVLEACVEAGLDGVCLLGNGTPPPIEEARASRFAARLALFFGVQFRVDRGTLVWIPADPAVLGAAECCEPAPQDAAESYNFV